MSDTIAAAIARANAACGRATAFVLEGAPPVTHADFNAAVASAARALAAAGAQPAHRIAFLAPRSPLGLSGFVAISSVAVCAPLNPRMNEAEFAAAFASLGISALVSGVGETPALGIAVRAGLPVFLLSEAGLAPAGAPRDFPAVTDAGLRGIAAGERPALLMQTSGTTSNPKLVLLSHGNVLAAAGAIGSAFSLGRDDLCLNPMPLHHVHGLISAGISSLLAASACFCTPSFSADAFDKWYRAFSPSWFTASPAMHLALREKYAPAGAAPANPRLRFLRSSSAPLPAAIIAELETLFGAPLIETYGLTETASMICTNPLPPARRKTGSVGVAWGAEMCIIDEQGRTLPAGEDGEIAVRGPSVITAYGEGAAEGYFVGDWLRTGDLGHADAEGYYFITGRKKELIKRGGLSVYPAEVDNALTGDARVAEAVAFAVPHPSLGEELVAAVVPAGGVALDGRTLRLALMEKLSSYKVPAEIFVVESIPKNEAGKFFRREMAQKFAALLAPKGQAPDSALESQLLEAWREVLQREDMGVTDNVCLMGADPLRAEKLVEALGRRGVPGLRAKDVYAAMTVREQAALLEARGRAA